MAKTGPKTNWKMTPEVLQKLEQAFAIDSTIAEACFYADISEAIYYKWVKENPELLEKFNRLRQKPVLTARQSVVGHLSKDPDFALKYLKNKRSSEFNEKTVQEVHATIDQSKIDDEINKALGGGESPALPQESTED